MYECNDEGTYTFCCEIENSVSDEDIYIYIYNYSTFKHTIHDLGSPSLVSAFKFDQ